MDIRDKFEKVNDDFLKFDRIHDKLNGRPDIHAFLLLDNLFPHPYRDIICASGHDEIWLDFDCDQIGSLSDDDILELTRCGVRYDEEHDCLAMFV